MLFRFSQTSRQSFRQQLEAFRPELYKIAWSWCHNTALADDLVQEACVKALKNHSQLNDSSKLKPWLTRILVNLHTDHLRAKRDQIPLEDQHLHDTESPVTLADRDDNIQRVRSAIAKLKDEHRKVVTLVDLAEFSYAEVAEILDVPVGTVMSRLNRARIRLKSLLQSDQHNQYSQGNGSLATSAKPNKSSTLRRVK